MKYIKKFPDGETPKTCVREGFHSNGDVKCKGCFEKKLEIDLLREKVKSLQTALKNRDKSTKEKPFGENTPSSKELKKNSSDDNRKKKGGAKPGHKGHGRDSHTKGDVVHHELPAIDLCPNCSVSLRAIDRRTRSIVDIHPIAAFKKLFSFCRLECPCCGDRFKAEVPSLPKFRLSNRLLAQVAIMHYLNGVPLKNICRIFGKEVNPSAFHSAFEKLSHLCAPAKTLLVNDFRTSKVKHADETGWRTDGHSGYAWYFGSKDTSVFEFRNTRSGAIAREVLGSEPMAGFLIVDRYGAYNKTKCKIQYCYAHILRDVKSLKIEFPENIEIERFVDALGTQLAQAMKLKQTKISDDEFYMQAREIKKKIQEIVRASALHLGIRRIQDIFIQKETRLYHWATDRDVPAHNNFAEREIRPTTIARKVSFGSQSQEGALRRSNIMTILYSAKKRLNGGANIAGWLEDALNQIAQGADPRILRVNPQ